MFKGQLYCLRLGQQAPLGWSCFLEGVNLARGSWGHDNLPTWSPGPCAPTVRAPRMACMDGPHTDFHGLCRPPPLIGLLRVGMHGGCKHLQAWGGLRGGCLPGCVIELWHQLGVSTACSQDCSWRETRNERKGHRVQAGGPESPYATSSHVKLEKVQEF